MFLHLNIMILPDIVLVAILIQNPTTQKVDLSYEPLKYYSNWTECFREEKRLSKKNQDNRKSYICVGVDRD
jgi:hypothetical protein